MQPHERVASFGPAPDVRVEQGARKGEPEVLHVGFAADRIVQDGVGAPTKVLRHYSSAKAEQDLDAESARLYSLFGPFH